MSASVIAESVPLRSLIVESQNGLSKRSGDSGDEVAVLRLADISEGRIDESDPRRIRLSPSEREKYALRRGDLICIRVNGSRGLVGRIVPFTSPNAWAYCDHFIRLRPDFGRADHRYLAYYLNSSPVRRQLELSMVSSAGQHTVSQGTMLDLPVPLPAIERQRGIVAEIEKQFSRLDEAVANLKRVKANLKRQRNTVLQAVTSGRLAAEGRAVPPAEAWRWLTIDELASSAPRSIQSGPFGSNLKHDEFQASGKLVIGIDNVRDGEFSIGSNHRISEAKFDELAKYAARPGDVLITVMATIGRVCVVPHDIEPAIITKHVYRITVNREMAVPDYVAIALRGSREVRAQLMGSVQGQTRPGLNGGLIKKIRVPVPPLAYQQSIVAEVDRRLSIARGVEAEVDANLKRAQALRQAVLKRAFGGPEIQD